VENYARAHLSDSTLLDSARRHRSLERGATAHLLADLGEIETRGLHLAHSYSSLYGWCRKELDLGEQAALKRVRASRAARRFPEILAMVADGRLHLSAIVLLKPRLTEETADDLFAAAAHKSCRQIERLIAERFPQADVPTFVQPLPAAQPGLRSQVSAEPAELRQLSTRTVEAASQTPQALPSSPPIAPVTSTQAPNPSSIRPLAPERFALQTTIDQETQDLLREAQELLGHVGSSQVPDVLKAALRLYVERLRKQKFGATDTPRPGRERNPDSRHIPEEVKRAVWAREGGQCAYKSANGHRCEERAGLEYDHIVPYARGGDSTVINVRLLCPAHNQFEADRTYGSEFTKQKREARRRSA